jgi:hypothetical protein
MVTERVKFFGAGMLCATLLAAVVFAFDPVRYSIFPPCPLHHYTGLWCPGCGTTRAMHQLLHGNVAAAFRFNPLAISLLPVMGYLVVRGEENAIKPVWIWTLLGVVVVFGVLRNIPIYPFTLLAP